MLTRLIQGEDAGERLSEGELLQNCVFILNAGHETTTNLIGNALVALQESPPALRGLLDSMAATRADAAAHETLLSTAVDEFLRFESSNQLGNRRAVKAVEVGGVPMEPGTLVTLCIGAANRDPAQFERPDDLDLGTGVPVKFDPAAQVAGLRAAIDEAPKSTRWKLRARVGDRVTWYAEPEEMEHRAL